MRHPVEVDGCMECPFHYSKMFKFIEWCGYSEAAININGPVPDWCPMRMDEITVLLTVKGQEK